MTSEKPLFIHLIGLEGCGHHGIFPIFEKLLSDKYAGTARRLFLRAGLRAYLNQIYCQRIPKDIVIPDLMRFLARHRDAVFVDDNSYPSHIYRNSGNQWDFAEFHGFLQDLCEIRFLRIRRNIFNTVNSHRDWDGGLLGHARVLADIHRFIEVKVSALVDRGVPVIDLDYDDILGSVGEISDMTGSDAETVAMVIAKVFQQSSKDYRDGMSAAEVAEIERLFGDNR